MHCNRRFCTLKTIHLCAFKFEAKPIFSIVAKSLAGVCKLFLWNFETNHQPNEINYSKKNSTHHIILFPLCYITCLRSTHTLSLSQSSPLSSSLFLLFIIFDRAKCLKIKFDNEQHMKRTHTHTFTKRGMNFIFTGD